MMSLWIRLVPATWDFSYRFLLIVNSSNKVLVTSKLKLFPISSVFTWSENKHIDLCAIVQQSYKKITVSFYYTSLTEQKKSLSKKNNAFKSTSFNRNCDLVHISVE